MMAAADFAECAVVRGLAAPALKDNF